MDEREMEQEPRILIGEGRMRAEADAERLVAALEIMTAPGKSDAFEAEKHRTRLVFSLERLRELGREAKATGGAFAPARAEVAYAILEAHTAVAAAFINRTMRRARRAPGRSELHARVDEAIALVEAEARAA